MNKYLWLRRKIVIDNICQNRNINTSCSNISYDQDIGHTGPKIFNLNISCSLVQRAIRMRHSKSRQSKEGSQIFDMVFRSGEYDGGMFCGLLPGTWAICT